MSDEIRPQLFVKHPDGTYSEYKPTGIETSEQPVAQRQWIEGSDDSNPGWYDYDEIDMSTSLRAGYEPLYAHPHTQKASE